MPNKTLRSLKPFETMRFGLTKPNLNLLATTKEGWGLCREEHLEGRMDSTQYQDILEANVQRSVQTLKSKRGWEFQQTNDPKHTSKSTTKYIQVRWMKALEWLPQSPDFNIIENLRRDFKQAIHARRPNNISELLVFCQEEWGELKKARIEKFFRWLQEAFISCYSCSRRSYKVVTDRVPKLLQWAFFLFLFLNCKICKKKKVIFFSIYVKKPFVPLRCTIYRS